MMLATPILPLSCGRTQLSTDTTQDLGDGVRPSPGAAISGWAGALLRLGAGLRGIAAAPESEQHKSGPLCGLDGRTPATMPRFAAALTLSLFICGSSLAQTNRIASIPPPEVAF